MGGKKRFIDANTDAADGSTKAFNAGDNHELRQAVTSDSSFRQPQMEK